MVGWAGVRNAWSEVATTIRTRWPASICRTIAGSVTVTGRAAVIDGESRVRRTGATRPALSVVAPAGSTSYSLTNSVAEPVGDAARSRTVGAPTTSTGLLNGPDWNAANCPGTSWDTPASSELSRPPAPGSALIAPGLPFGGLAIGCGGPLTVRAARPVPVSPGYVGSE